MVYWIQWLLLLRLVLLFVLLLSLKKLGATKSIQISSWIIAANYRDVIIVEWLVWLDSLIDWHVLQLGQSYHYLLLGASTLSEVFVDHSVELFLLFRQSRAPSFLNRWKHWRPQRHPAVYSERWFAMLWLVTAHVKFALRALFGNDWMVEGASFLTGWLVTHKVLIRLTVFVLFVFFVITCTLVSNIQIHDLLITLVFFWKVL